MVQFTDTSTPVGCPIDSWSWDFGDGSPPSTEQNPQHTFTNPGPEPVDYTVTLTATSAAGDSEATVGHHGRSGAMSRSFRPAATRARRWSSSP